MNETTQNDSGHCFSGNKHTLPYPLMADWMNLIARTSILIQILLNWSLKLFAMHFRLRDNFSQKKQYEGSLLDQCKQRQEMHTREIDFSVNLSKTRNQG